MKLLKSLNQPADNCIILTYNLDLLFFEYMLYPSLYASGCRNTMVLCDPIQYELALQHDIAQLHYVGQQYLLLPVRSSPHGAFHPKLIFLTSRESGILCLLSGNLTKTGYLHNWEVLTLFEYQAKKPDPIAWQACRWAVDTLSQVVQATDLEKLGQERLEQLWGTTPWLHHEPPLPTSAPVWPLHNLSAPLFDQFVSQYRAQDGSAIDEVIAISPFFDTNALAIAKIVTTLHPRSLQLYTQGNTHGLDPAKLASILNRSPLEFQAYALNLGNRRLHAKTLLVRTQKGAWLVTGSANLSRPAWLHPAAMGNTEMVVLRFEPDSGYFDAWLAELINEASPLSLAEMRSAPDNSIPYKLTRNFILLAATFESEHLELHLASDVSSEGVLTVNLVGEVTWQKVYNQWQHTDLGILTLKLDQDRPLFLDRPTLVYLEVQTESEQMRSNPVLLHNLTALERSKHPVDRRERPRIPEGMQPDSNAHCAALLDMLHDLLAVNKEQLYRHRGVIPATLRRDEQEQKQAIEEGEYEAEAHFVDEKIRRPGAGGGIDLYVDYYDRLTYEEVLRAVLAAVYHPASDSTNSLDATGSSPAVTISIPAATISAEEEVLKAKMLARIESGFQRLVDNFLKGLADQNYLIEVPPRYLVELFIIITSYLHIIWRDGILKRELFINHSLRLMAGFWGQLDQPGAWQTLTKFLTAEDRQVYEEQLALSAQIWLHTFIVTQQLAGKKDARLYECAAWIRHVQKELSSSKTLAKLPDQQYQRLWRFSQPASTEFIPASEVVGYLDHLSQKYNEETLKAEILTWPGTKANINTGPIGGLNHVPLLHVKRPLKDIDLDLFWQTFLLFLRSPSPKRRAWARFENTNPLENDDEVKAVVIFYRDDERVLICDVVRKSDERHPSVTLENVSVEDLQIIQSFAELQVFAE